ncbi:MAG TPA: response regulator [Planctomycetota bacterium]|jgi:DNA-binding response OmpR family regulator|nr:response regulator [Planctomycetota bacterium]
MVSKSPVVLFADRDLSWSRDVRIQLRRRGAEVRMASRVDDALKQAAEAAPDLVILDDDLEGRGSRDLVDLFREKLPEAELILLESDAPGIPRGAGQGLFFSGAKPISPTMLLSLAESALEGRLTKAPDNGVSLKRSTVLCVDDDPRYLRSVSRFLDRHGYDVSTFETAEGALGALPRLKPDLALVDVMMPGMGGLDLAEKIRETTRGKTPVVFLTALDSEEAYFEGHERGGAFMIGKSEKPQKVLDVVDYFAGDLDEPERELIKHQL